MLRLLGNSLLNGEFTSVVAAAGAYSVIYIPLTAVGALSECGGNCLIVSSTLESSGLRLSSFRMCHFVVIF